jgi:enoyl-CoA hydratase/carnithine racemase
MEHKVVNYESREGIATITLNRPERLNAWTGQMNLEYRTALAHAADDPAIRVIVVTGAGRGFCAGADVDALAGHAARGAYDDGLPDSVPTPGWGVRPEFDAELAYHLGIAKPIIAMVNGPAAGLGFALMCWCDLRFAAADARLTSAHGRLGLPAEFGLSWLLPRIVGLTRAADILLSSRIFTAEEGYQMGLLNAVVPPEELGERVRDYARGLATTFATTSLAVTKRQLYRDLLTSDPAASVRDAEQTMTAMMGEPEYREGVTALREKRPPRYR